MNSLQDRKPADYGRFIEAAIALSIATLFIAALPFRTVVGTASWGGERRRGAESPANAGAIVQAVDRAARRLPWRLVCIHKGLAVHWMLRRRGLPSRLHYGIAGGDNHLTAHVWVSLGGEILIGGAEAASHALVATFPEDMS